ncbi:MAG: copper chaperone NosL [Planctomycetota bacterium]|jgi:copper chaperone NosL
MKRGRWSLLTCVLLMACGAKEVQQIESAPIAAAEACALDGMLLAYHEGPKAQLLRKNGERAFFCDSKEIFGELLDPVRRRQVAGIWFQALDDARWEAHADGWVRAEVLFFVVGSAKMGAMGPTLAPFSARKKAEVFAREHGGEIYRFDEIGSQQMQILREQAIAEWEK